MHWRDRCSQLDDNEELVKSVKRDFLQADISKKMKALLEIAGKVQRGSKCVMSDDVQPARRLDALDLQIHDTVLIAAAFCMYNRYGDGLATWQPEDAEMYRERGKLVARDGYVAANPKHRPSGRRLEDNSLREPSYGQCRSFAIA